MAAMSNYLEAALLDATLRDVPYTSPSTVYLALFINDPTDAGTGTEVSGGSYARQVVTFQAPTNGACINAADVLFEDMPAVTVTHVGIYDAVSGGNLLYHGQLAAFRAVQAGDDFLIRASDLTIALD